MKIWKAFAFGLGLIAAGPPGAMSVSQSSVDNFCSTANHPKVRFETKLGGNSQTKFNTRSGPN